ncbi:hypothetical protein ABMA27_006284 [Loxostege sticticalis]|uniref:Uncharacterized protein n=1 Tax=Loxostege sticticalis TaxID=481309 RepID=A0ABR3HIA6_LOXSC
MSEKKMSCAQCQKVIKHKQFLKCARCKLPYDLKCTNKEKLYNLMDKERKAKWICDNCRHKGTPKNSQPIQRLQSHDKQKTVIKGKNIDLKKPAAINPMLSVENMDSKLHDDIYTDNVTHRKKQTERNITSIPTRNSFDSLQTDINDAYDDDDEYDFSCITPPKLNRSCPEIIIKSHLDYEAIQLKLYSLQQKYESAENQIEILLSENFTLKKTIEQYKSRMCNLTSMCKNTDQLSEKKCKSDSIRKSIRKRRSTNNCSFTTEATPLSPPVETTKRHEYYTDNKQKRKINLISTNKNNKVLSLALRTFQDKYQLCHYKLPHQGILDTLQTITEKTRLLTKGDYCVIMVGEKDFETSQNYSLLVKQIRNKLINLNHTNIIICLPTFKCGILTQLFNRRIEIFNRILYLDIKMNEYAYILDSNRHLTYDYKMFSGPQGIMNNRGMTNVLADLKLLIEDIQLHTSSYDDPVSSMASQSEEYCEISTEEFFRG